MLWLSFYKDREPAMLQIAVDLAKLKGYLFRR